ncbi:thiamine pyrophosphate-binding protein [Bradyrhizobium sp. INPA03-11B]|uniref:thiamine pyrophosphate-binding protein n=1 Tax=Bradyrhizobium sp. INPA03-11B TaxID=418598 RepID=UPI00338FCBD8
MQSHSNAIALKKRRGADVLVDTLRLHGAEAAFCVPGESYLAVLDSLYDKRDEFKLIVCRHEGGVAFMAEAHAKATGKPGIAFVTRGPGATNASIGVHTAFQDSTPMILFIGQVARAVSEREAFQEIDYRRMFGPMAKWVGQIDDASRIPEYVSRAYHTAMSGRRGPVVLALPEDMLLDVVAVDDGIPYQVPQPHPSDEDMQRIAALLTKARRPLMILGGSGWSAQACRDISRFAVAHDLPVACSFRRQDLFDNCSPNYAGDVCEEPRLDDRIRQSDLLLLVGARMGEIPSGSYTLLDIPRPKQAIVQVHPGAEELGKIYQADVLVHAGMPAFAARAARLEPVGAPAWREWTANTHCDYLESLKLPACPGAVDMGRVAALLRRVLSPETVITHGAGNFSAWARRHYQYRQFGTMICPTSGSMGYALPGAIAAKIADPGRPVICVTGDGDFLMNSQELSTAVRYGLPIVVILINNNMYGTIRLYQERAFPARVHGTDLSNPDFAAYARSFGAHGVVVERTEQFEPAFVAALAADRLTVIEVRVDQEALTPEQTLSQIRAAAQQQNMHA